MKENNISPKINNYNSNSENDIPILPQNNFTNKKNNSFK